MQVDFLIIGQGISGTWLSYFLQQQNRSFFIIDQQNPNAPSRLAAGIINPVTGRRHVEVWMANELMPFVHEAYTEMGNTLQVKAISYKDIIDFFPSPQMRLSFLQRVEEKANYVSVPAEENQYREFFNYDFGFGAIQPVYTVHLENILPAWRNTLIRQQQIREEEFDHTDLTVSPDGIRYRDIRASRIIFCDGTVGSSNPFFRNLPFAPNKGEALTLQIPGLPASHIYKRGLSLVPLAAEGHWWIGSNNQWEFDNPAPTALFKDSTLRNLQQWLKIPFEVTGHVAGIRPATLERRPFVGFHPLFPAVGILNGMGTKGCSLAPYFAREMANHLLLSRPIDTAADISRFARILQRP